MGYTTEESKVTTKILSYLDGLQEKGAPLYYEHRSGSGGFNYKKGSPDLFIVYDGRHMEVELKALNGQPSTMQIKWQYKCEQIWHIPYCRPHSFEEFKAWFLLTIKREPE